MRPIDPQVKEFLVELDALENEKRRIDQKMSAVYARAAASGVPRSMLKQIRRDNRQRRLLARRPPPGMPPTGEFME